MGELKYKQKSLTASSDKASAIVYKDTTVELTLDEALEKIAELEAENAELNRNLTTITRGASTWNTQETNFTPSKSSIFVDKINGIPLASITCKVYVSLLSANTAMHIATTEILPKNAIKFHMTVVAGTTIYNDNTVTLEIATDGKIYIKSSAGIASGSPRVLELVGETYFTQ